MLRVYLRRKHMGISKTMTRKVLLAPSSVVVGARSCGSPAKKRQPCGSAFGRHVLWSLLMKTAIFQLATVRWMCCIEYPSTMTAEFQDFECCSTMLYLAVRIRRLRPEKHSMAKRATADVDTLALATAQSANSTCLHFVLRLRSRPFCACRGCVA